MMKRMIALLCALVLIGTVCCGCSIFPIPKRVSKPTVAPAPSETVAATQEATTAPATQAPAVIGKLSDYVKTGKEATVVMSGGKEKHLRLPEIRLDSTDAAAANNAIDGKFGEYIDDKDAHDYVISLDYEAYLNDKILSVLVKGSVDGGNSYGQCYCFDVLTGVKLSNVAVCELTGHDYDAACAAIGSNLKTYYDEKYSGLPGNDEMRSQTLDESNVKNAIMYLDGSGKLMAMTDIYAAVGGGHWVESIPAE